LCVSPLSLLALWGEADRKKRNGDLLVFGLFDYVGDEERKRGDGEGADGHLLVVGLLAVSPNHVEGGGEKER